MVRAEYVGDLGVNRRVTLKWIYKYGIDLTELIHYEMKRRNCKRRNKPSTPIHGDELLYHLIICQLVKLKGTKAFK
jgi:hypothetical protein